MTPFEIAAERTLGIEGGFSDNPSDKGGATQWGITEAVARADGYDGDMKALPKERALSIYRRLYWSRIGLDWVAQVDPEIAAECFDTAVNMGVGVAVKFLQRCLNALNRQGKDYRDISVDGVAGAATRQALGGLYATRGADARSVLLAYLNALQGARYIELAEARMANETFVFGWAKRLGVLLNEASPNAR